MTVLDVHILEAIAVLLHQQLVEEDLLEVDSFDVEHGDKTIHIALVAHHVITVTLLLVHIYVLVDHGLRRAHFQCQVQGDVFESK